MTKATCIDCDAVLSRYRKPREVLCAPCERRRIDTSLEHAHSSPSKPSRPFRAFAARWRGFEWESVATVADYPSPSSAQSAARDYAKRHRMILP